MYLRDTHAYTASVRSAIQFAPRLFIGSVAFVRKSLFKEDVERVLITQGANWLG